MDASRLQLAKSPVERLEYSTMAYGAGVALASAIDYVRSVGIDAIPAHIFGRRYLVMGAQPYEVLKEVVDRLNPPG